MPLDAEHVRRTKVVKTILDIALKSVKKTERASVEQFIGQYFSQIALDALQSMDPEALAGLAMHHLSSAATHKPGEPLVTLYHPTLATEGWDLGHTVVEIITADKPFLIDSITAEMNRLGFGVHISIHPVMRMRRTAAGKLTEVLEPALLGIEKGVVVESLIHLQIDEQPEICHAEIKAGLLEVLGDIELAVRDWRAMRTTLGDLVDELETLTANLPLEEVS